MAAPHCHPHYYNDSELIHQLANNLCHHEHGSRMMIRGMMKSLGYKIHHTSGNIVVNKSIWSAEMWTERDDDDPAFKNAHMKRRVCIVHNHTDRVWFMSKFHGKEAPTMFDVIARTLHQQPHQGEPDDSALSRRSHFLLLSLNWNTCMSVEAVCDPTQTLLSEYDTEGT
jgi:hypothetical protein